MECSICAGVSDTRVIMPCGHSEICLHCYIRLKKCYHSSGCYFCQKEVIGIPVATKQAISYEEATQSATNVCSDVELKYVEESISDEIKKTSCFSCSVCDSGEIGDIEQFKNHIRTHNQRICEICANSERYLPYELEIFSDSAYKDHMKHHPKCCCCEFVAFDARTLEHHMTEFHVRCDICLRLNKITWMKDVQSLVKHNEEKHFVCHYPECSSENMIAFARRADLINHLRKQHGEQTRDIDITCDFDCGEVPSDDNTRQKMIELNRRFMARLRSVFTDEPDVIDRLKIAARQLIEDRITAGEFYARFSQHCGAKKNQVFTDMVAIMPDPAKRAALLRLHENVSGRVFYMTPGPMSKSISLPEVPRSEPAPAPAPAPAPGRKRRPKRTILFGYE